MEKLHLNESGFKNISNGSVWCLSRDFEESPNAEEGVEDGNLYKLYFKDRFVAIGYYNKHSNYKVGVLTRRDAAIDKDFFVAKFEAFKREKEKFLLFTNSYRFVFSEGDNLPGLIVDLFEKVAVIQILSLGIDKLKEHIVQALLDVLRPFSIYEKSDLSHYFGKKDPTLKRSGVLYGKLINPVEIKENGFKFSVDIVNGEKTGFFLDQRENRQTLQKYALNKTILSAFCYTGAFSVYTAKDAKSVTSIDISSSSIESTKNNFKLNLLDIESHNFIVGDALNYLKTAENSKFDIIILNPPPFSDNSSDIKEAIKSYIIINSFALLRLPDYGILATSSTTPYIDEKLFLKILQKSSINAKCQVRVLEINTQPQDHTYNLSYEDGRYLKFVILQKLPPP